MARELQAWSPFRELERFRRDFDDLFGRFFGAGSAELSPVLAGPPIESWVEGDKMFIRADLPGVDPNDVEVTVAGNTLTLRARRESRKEQSDRDFTHREIGYGVFERTLGLPAGVKADDIKANYDHGVLELIVPLPKELSARKVPIQIHDGQAEQVESKQSGQK